MGRTTEGEAMSELASALAKAQQAFKPVTKSQTNKHFGSKYADLSDVLAAVIPALNAQGIAVTQPIEDGELVTRLTLGSEHIESRIPLNLDVKPQELGSQLTYLRRYSLSALVCVASEDDDDGNAASTAKPRAPKMNEAPYRKSEPAVNDDGEPLATKDQRDQFVALCEAADLDKADRAALVKLETERSAWNQVTRADADKLIASFAEYTLAKGQDGKWFAYEKDTEPFDVEPVQEALPDA